MRLNDRSPLKGQGTLHPMLRQRLSLEQAYQGTGRHTPKAGPSREQVTTWHYIHASGRQVLLTEPAGASTSRGMVALMAARDSTSREDKATTKAP